MKRYDTDEIEIDLKELFFALKKKLWLIILITVLSATGVGLYSKFVMVPQYTSTAMVYVLSKETTLTSLADLQIGSQLTNDYTVLVTSRPVLEQVLENLGISSDYMTYHQLRDKITIDNPTDTRIMNITVQDKSPIDAKAYVDEIASTASTYISEIMEMTPPKIVEEGEISAIPVSPNVMKNTVLGGLAGCVVVCGIVILLALMNDTIRDEDDIERYLELSVLAAVPLYEKSSKEKIGVEDSSKSRKKKQ